jgi:hypothetical protein
LTPLNEFFQIQAYLITDLVVGFAIFAILYGLDGLVVRKGLGSENEWTKTDVCELKTLERQCENCSDT